VARQYPLCADRYPFCAASGLQNIPGIKAGSSDSPLVEKATLAKLTVYTLYLTDESVFSALGQRLQ